MNIEEKKLAPITKAMLRKAGIECNDRLARIWLERGWDQLACYMDKQAAFTQYLEERA